MAFNRRQVRLKYGSKKIENDGYSFASKLEAALYQTLKLRKAADEIDEIAVQAHVKLTDAKILYIVDFVFFDKLIQQYVWAEAKGYPTDVWAIKKRLWKHYGPGKLEIWGGVYQSPVLIETVIPVMGLKT